MQLLLDTLPISHEALLFLKFTYHPGCKYYCPPFPANGSTYRLKHEATIFMGSDPVAGSEQWKAFIPLNSEPTIRRFDTLRELNFFHKGMCDSYLY